MEPDDLERDRKGFLRCKLCNAKFVPIIVAIEDNMEIADACIYCIDNKFYVTDIDSVKKRYIRLKNK
jgi:hypothetical protein